MSHPDLSVVIASTGGGDRPDLLEALTSLQRACQGIPTEFLVVSAGQLELEPPPWTGSGAPEIRVEHRPSGTLTPVLWGDGARIARGRWIAFTTDRVRVTSSWANSWLEPVRAGAAGAGGPIEVAQGASPPLLAAHLIRFSAFLPTAWPSRIQAKDIPGDNAVYRREVLFRHADLLAEGFWEFEFHRRFEREGEFLEMVPGARATLTSTPPFGTLLRHRFRHGREFGASRVRRHGASRLRLVLAAPLVPFVLMARIARRAVAGSVAGHFLMALPWLALLAAAWAAGEAAGAIASDGREAA